MEDIEGIEGEQENEDRSLFEALVATHGVPLVTTIQTAECTSLTQDGEEILTAGQSAVVGLVMGGLSAVQVADEPQAAVDRDHQWLVSFAVTRLTIDGIINTLIETREWMEKADEQDANVRELRPGTGETEGDGGVADDPEQAG